MIYVSLVILCSSIEVSKMGKIRAVHALALLSAVIVIALPISSVNAQETLIFSADVPSDGTSVTSPVLEAGREYRIVARGVFESFPPPFRYWADAQYYTTEGWEISYDQPDGHSFLQINGMDVVWGMWSNTPYYHTYTIYRIGTGAQITFQIVDWIDGDYTNNECHFHVYIWEGPPVPPEAETAYAYGGDYATCFLSLGFRNWGWTNGPLGHGHYEFDIYAGAAKCNLNKGTKVGTLTIDYVGSTATVTYMMDAEWAMERTQLYVGSESLPMKGGEYTTSPGQYPYIHDPVADPAYDEYTVTGLSGDIYVVAHADVFEV